MVGLVNEKSLAGEILGQVLAREAVQGRVGTSKSVVEGSRLAEVVDDPLHRAESAFPRPLDQGLGDLNRGNSRAPAIREGDQLVVPFDKALLDLLLGRRDHCMAKPRSQVHGHQGNNLHGLARTRGLLDQDVFGSPADIGDQWNLVGSQSLGRGFHNGLSWGGRTCFFTRPAR